jgi:hypothetical protein
MRIRPGGPDDIAAVLALGDEAVKWMNARGNTQQWGTAPWTGNDKREAAIGDQARGSGTRIAEDQDGVVLGALVITEIPAAYVPPAAERELYINLLLVSPAQRPGHRRRPDRAREAGGRSARHRPDPR